jgi:hypothetical protein
MSCTHEAKNDPWPHHSLLLINFVIQALDKIRFEGLTDKSKLDTQPELFIHVVPDKTNKSLTIIDSGIGMTKAGKIFVFVLAYAMKGSHFLSRSAFLICLCFHSSGLNLCHLA